MAIRDTVEPWLVRNQIHKNYRADTEDYLKNVVEEAKSLNQRYHTAEAHLLKLAKDCLTHLQRKSVDLHMTALRTFKTQMEEFRRGKEQMDSSVETIQVTTSIANGPLNFEGLTDWLNDESSSQSVNRRDQNWAHQSDAAGCVTTHPATVTPESGSTDRQLETAASTSLRRRRAESEETEIYPPNKRSARAEPNQEDDVKIVYENLNNRYYNPPIGMKVKQEPTSPRSMPPTHTSEVTSEMQTTGQSTSGMQTHVNPPAPAFEPCGDRGCPMCVQKYPDCQKKNIVYRLVCTKCEAIFIGESSKPLGYVFKLLMRSIESIKRGGLYKHILKCNTITQPKSTRFRAEVITIEEDADERSKIKKREIKSLENPINLYHLGNKPRFGKGEKRVKKAAVTGAAGTTSERQRDGSLDSVQQAEAGPSTESGAETSCHREESGSFDSTDMSDY